MNNNRTCYLRNWSWHRLDCADRGMQGLGEDVLLTFFFRIFLFTFRLTTCLSPCSFAEPRMQWVICFCPTCCTTEILLQWLEFLTTSLPRSIILKAVFSRGFPPFRSARFGPCVFAEMWSSPRQKDENINNVPCNGFLFYCSGLLTLSCFRLLRNMQEIINFPTFALHWQPEPGLQGNFPAPLLLIYSREKVLGADLSGAVDWSKLLRLGLFCLITS